MSFRRLGSGCAFLLAVLTLAACSDKSGEPSVEAAAAGGADASGGEASVLESGDLSDIEIRGADTSWAPEGYVPGLVDRYLMVSAEYWASACCEESTSGDTSSCIKGRYWLTAPRMQWLVCAGRLAEESESVAAYFDELLGKITPGIACQVREECQLADCEPSDAPTEPPALLACGPKEAGVCTDVAGYTQGERCNGVGDCDDGLDEENCPPLSTGFSCDGTQVVAWARLCDGTADCSNGSDESMCVPHDPVE